MRWQEALPRTEKGHNNINESQVTMISTEPLLT